MFTTKNREKLEPTVRDEFDNASAESMQRFLTEHNHDGTHNVRPSGFDFVPIGGGLMWFSDDIPDGWLSLDGSQVSRTTYQSLFNIFGTTYGAGDGSTTFNLPDLRQRFPLGKAAAGTGSSLGDTGGAIDHVHTGPSHTHSISTEAAHGHTIEPDGDHSHTGTTEIEDEAGNSVAAGADFIAPPGRFGITGGHTHDFTSGTDGEHDHGGATTGAGAHDHGGATGSSGSGNTGSNNPPFLTVHFIVLAGV